MVSISPGCMLCLIARVRIETFHGPDSLMEEELVLKSIIQKCLEECKPHLLKLVRVKVEGKIGLCDVFNHINRSFLALCSKHHELDIVLL